MVLKYWWKHWSETNELNETISLIWDLFWRTGLKLIWPVKDIQNEILQPHHSGSLCPYHNWSKISKVSPLPVLGQSLKVCNYTTCMRFCNEWCYTPQPVHCTGCCCKNLQQLLSTPLSHFPIWHWTSKQIGRDPNPPRLKRGRRLHLPQSFRVFNLESFSQLRMGPTQIVNEINK